MDELGVPAAGDEMVCVRGDGGAEGMGELGAVVVHARFGEGEEDVAETAVDGP